MELAGKERSSGTQIDVASLDSCTYQPRRIRMRSKLAISALIVASLLGATAEPRGWLNNDAVNFLSTIAASVIAIAILVLS